MRYILVLVVLIAAFSVYMVAYRRNRNNSAKLFIIGLALLILSVIGIKGIYVNTPSVDVESIINTVNEAGLVSVVRVTDADNVEVLVDGTWTDVKDIEFLGIISDKMTIKIGRVTHEIGDSGIINAIKVLESIGILD